MPMVNRRRFGWIRELPSGRFQASYRDPNTGRRITGPDTYRFKTDAQRWLVNIEADLNRGELPDLSLGRMSFEKWAEQWLKTRQVRKRTGYRYESIVRNLLVPQFGARRINSINRNDVVAFVSSIANSGQESKAADARRFLSMIFAEAVRSNGVRLNPAEGVRVKRHRREEMTFLTRTQVVDLADSISARTVRRRGGHEHTVKTPEYALLVKLTAETGMRAGEVAALRVGRVHLDRRFLEIADTVSEVAKADAPNGLLYDAPKNYERRSVPLPATLAQELAEHLKSRPGDADAFVFTMPNGGPLRHTNFYDRYYKPAVVAAGLPSRTRFHDLRHTYAALLIAAGANPLTIKQRMGHSSITVTMDRYGHLFPHLEADITDRMDEAYRLAIETTNSTRTARQVRERTNENLNDIPDLP
jgi:integrase